ncbi:uncharacterized protein JCM10292_003524 [Rhodotorula paludigena]|uniref:uncharacterized protein n=1 Tax=Rhodotorula paludigena TaxID=86838 RepID=UPI00316C2057
MYDLFVEEREDELPLLVAMCEGLDIVLAGDVVQVLAERKRDARWQSWYRPADLRFVEVPSDEQGSTASESVGDGDEDNDDEEDAMDYDAEDDVTFRSLWSLEKRKALDVKDAFKLLEPHIKAGVSADEAHRTIEELLE